MPTFINAFTWNQAPNEEFKSLLPAQAAKAKDLLARGVIRYLFLAADNSGGWAIYSGESRDEILKTIDQLPLRKFMNVNVKELQDTYSAAEAAN